ncbi:hypothetical protein [Flavobacterium anhuiense]|uniref:hypothetical protein n=1 Tax=Flavobacterium anhuiense TaxID=459526 RepID=UPI003D98CC5E
MRKLIFLFLLVCLSCNKSQFKKSYCLKKAEYFAQLDMLVPESAIKLYIEDKDSVLQKKVNLEKTEKILFYKIKEKDRNLFHLVKPEIKSFKIESGIITIPVLTAYFRPDIYINGVRSKNIWTSAQIQEVIGDEIGLIIEKDTILIRRCNCPK